MTAPFEISPKRTILLIKYPIQRQLTHLKQSLVCERSEHEKRVWNSSSLKTLWFWGPVFSKVVKYYILVKRNKNKLRYWENCVLLCLLDYDFIQSTCVFTIFLTLKWIQSPMTLPTNVLLFVVYQRGMPWGQAHTSPVSCSVFDPVWEEAMWLQLCTL